MNYFCIEIDHYRRLRLQTDSTHSKLEAILAVTKSGAIKKKKKSRLLSFQFFQIVNFHFFFTQVKFLSFVLKKIFTISWRFLFFFFSSHSSSFFSFLCEIEGIEMRLSESTAVVEERERCIEKKVEKIIFYSCTFVFFVKFYYVLVDFRFS